MLLFCPMCGSRSIPDESSGITRIRCCYCPYRFNIGQKFVIRNYTKPKPFDIVLGHSAWENVDATDEKCPKCDSQRAYFMQIQIRSADEPMTNFYKCCSPACGYRWRGD